MRLQPPLTGSLVSTILVNQQDSEEAFARAVVHGDEHVIKFADTAVDVFERTQDSQALAAVYRATAAFKPERRLAENWDT